MTANNLFTNRFVRGPLPAMIALIAASLLAGCESPEKATRTQMALKQHALARDASGEVWLAGDQFGRMTQLQPGKGQLAAVIDSKVGILKHLTVSPDGRFAAGVNADDTAMLWDLKTQRRLLDRESGAPQIALTNRAMFINVIEGNPEDDDPKDWESTIRVIDLNSQEEVARLPYPNLHAYPRGNTQADMNALRHQRVLSMSASPNGRELAIGTNRGLYIINVLRHYVRTSPSSNRINASVPLVRWTHDGDYVLYCAYHQSAGLLDPGSRRIVTTFETRASANFAAGAVSPNNRYVAMTTRDDRVLLFDAKTGKRLHIWRAGNIDTRGIIFSADGKEVLTGSQGGILPLAKWDVK